MGKSDKEKPTMTVVGNADDMAQAANALERVGDTAAKAAEDLEATQAIEINTMNEFGLGMQMKTIRPIAFPQFETRQQAWRFAARLKLMAEALPEEPMDHTFEEIENAIKNS